MALDYCKKSPKLSKKFKTLQDLTLKKDTRKEDESAAPTLYRGVTNSRTRSGGRWVAQFSGGRGKQLQLGTFATQLAAAHAMCDYLNKSKKRKAEWGLDVDEEVTPNDLLLRKRGKVSSFIARFKFLHNLYTCLEEEPCYPGALPPIPPPPTKDRTNQLQIQIQNQIQIQIQIQILIQIQIQETWRRHWSNMEWWRT